MEKGKRCSAVTRGQATLFGFKKPSVPQTVTTGGGGGGGGTPTQPSLPSVPASVVTQETIEPLVIAPVQPRQGTPKLGRAKKDGKTANRFGFRTAAPISNKVADLQQTHSRSESDFRQTVRPQSVPAFKLTSARSVSETRYNNKSAGTTRSGGNNTQSSVTGSVSKINSLDQSSQQQPQRSTTPSAGKYALFSTQLPQPQNAYYRPASGTNTAADNGGPSVDKWAKTKANNQKAAQSKQFQSSSASNTSSSSPTDSGIAVQKQRRNDSVLEIQQLEHSPNMAHKFRNLHQQQKSRPMEMIFTDTRTKRFDLRDVGQVQPVRPLVMAGGGLVGSTNELIASTTTSVPAVQQQQQSCTRDEPSNGHHHHHHHHHQSSTSVQHHQQPQQPFAANCLPLRTTSASSGDEGFDETSNGEEKQSRDKLISEKVRLSHSPDEEDTVNLDGEDEETLWGRGEAMALDDQIPCANIADIDQSPESTTPRLRSVLLTIEDPEFTSLAVLSNSTAMLEDEVSPESPDLSCSSPSSVEPLPPPPQNLAETPGSPGTPTHATNSLSSDAKDRDFLIDDEIADQPGLVFGTEDRHNQSHHLHIGGTGGGRHDHLEMVSAMAADDTSILDTSRTIAKLAGEVSQVLASVNGQGNLRNRQQSDSMTSLNTLSPCESLASDDLIADYDRSDISVPFDDLNELDDVPLKSEILSQSDQVMKEWTSLLSSHPG